MHTATKRVHRSEDHPQESLFLHLELKSCGQAPYSPSSLSLTLPPIHFLLHLLILYVCMCMCVEGRYLNVYKKSEDNL